MRLITSDHFAGVVSNSQMPGELLFGSKGDTFELGLLCIADGIAAFSGATGDCNWPGYASTYFCGSSPRSRCRTDDASTESRARRVSAIGLHYGPVVLGDIGLTCLEFAVIGSTVNAASRFEALTRPLGCALVASDDLVKRAKTELGSADAAFRPLMAQSPQTIRGLEQPIAIWTQARAEE
jgi:Adenylate and Guanylate cyclase catalytic domain